MKVFISYAPVDAELARRVADVLKAAGFQVWDNSQVLPGDNWGAKLAEALQDSEAMVVLLTPNSLRSPNIQFEWATRWATGTIKIVWSLLLRLLLTNCQTRTFRGFLTDSK